MVAGDSWSIPEGARVAQPSRRNPFHHPGPSGHTISRQQPVHIPNLGFSESPSQIPYSRDHETAQGVVPDSSRRSDRNRIRQEMYENRESLPAQGPETSALHDHTSLRKELEAEKQKSRKLAIEKEAIEAKALQEVNEAIRKAEAQHETQQHWKKQQDAMEEEEKDKRRMMEAQRQAKEEFRRSEEMTLQRLRGEMMAHMQAEKEAQMAREKSAKEKRDQAASEITEKVSQEKREQDNREMFQMMMDEMRSQREERRRQDEEKKREEDKARLKALEEAQRETERREFEAETLERLEGEMEERLQAEKLYMERERIGYELQRRPFGVFPPDYNLAQASLQAFGDQQYNTNLAPPQPLRGHDQRQSFASPPRERHQWGDTYAQLTPEVSRSLGTMREPVERNMAAQQQYYGPDQRYGDRSWAGISSIPRDIPAVNQDLLHEGPLAEAIAYILKQHQRDYMASIPSPEYPRYPLSSERHPVFETEQPAADSLRGFAQPRPNQADSSPSGPRPESHLPRDGREERQNSTETRRGGDFHPSLVAETVKRRGGGQGMHPMYENHHGLAPLAVPTPPRTSPSTAQARPILDNQRPSSRRSETVTGFPPPVEPWHGSHTPQKPPPWGVGDERKGPCCCSHDHSRPARQSG